MCCSHFVLCCCWPASLYLTSWPAASLASRIFNFTFNFFTFNFFNLDFRPQPAPSSASTTSLEAVTVSCASAPRPAVVQLLVGLQQCLPVAPAARILCSLSFQAACQPRCERDPPRPSSLSLALSRLQLMMLLLHCS